MFGRYSKKDKQINNLLNENMRLRIRIAELERRIASLELENRDYYPKEPDYGPMSW